MWHKRWMAGMAVLAVGIAGCGKSGSTGSTAANSPGASAQPAAQVNSGSVAIAESPVHVVTNFLEAYRTGSEEKAVPLLSSTARTKMAEAGLNITPPASDTARYEVGEIEYLKEDGTTTKTCPQDCAGARVAWKWIAPDEAGQLQTDHALWIVRREADGWRIAGMAAYVFEGEPPLLMNYEDPQDMIKKQQWFREELERRSHQENSQAENGKNVKDSVRR